MPIHHCQPYGHCIAAQLLFTQMEPLCAQKLGGSIAQYTVCRHGAQCVDTVHSVWTGCTVCRQKETI